MPQQVSVTSSRHSKCVEQSNKLVIILSTPNVNSNASSIASSRQMANEILLINVFFVLNGSLKTDEERFGKTSGCDVVFTKLQTWCLLLFIH